MENEIKDSRGDAERQRAQSETLVDIVAEMRSIAKPGETFEHTYELLCGFADRIEAAYKRDIEKLNSVIQATVSRSDTEIDRLRREVAELRKQIGNEYPSSEASPRSGCPGNGAKLREAIKSLMDNLQIHAMMPCEQITMNRAEVCAMIEDCRAALATPARNCDVISNRDDAVRIFQAAFVEAAARHLHLTNAAYVKIIEPLGELLEIAIEVLYSTYHAEDSAAQNKESEVSHGNA